jgi:hypothetical protein
MPPVMDEPAADDAGHVCIGVAGPADRLGLLAVEDSVFTHANY